MSESKRHRWGPRRERTVSWQDGTVGAYDCIRCGCEKSSGFDVNFNTGRWMRYTVYTMPTGDEFIGKAPPCVPKETA